LLQRKFVTELNQGRIWTRFKLDRRWCNGASVHASFLMLAYVNGRV